MNFSSTDQTVTKQQQPAAHSSNKPVTPPLIRDENHYPYKCYMALLFVLLAANAFAAIRVEKVVPGIQGFTRAERWIPITFSITNTGSNFQGVLEVNRGESFFRRSIDLAAQSGKEVEVLVYYSSHYGPLEYRILNNDGSKVREDRLQVTGLNAKDNLVLVLSDVDYNHQFLNGVPNPWGGKTFVAYLKPEQLYTEWLAYSSADAIVLGSLPPQMSSSRWKALIQYAACGGILVCSSGTSLSAFEHPFFRQALPDFQKEYSLMIRSGCSDVSQLHRA